MSDNRTILVIDDEPIVLGVVEASLRHEGWEVVSAINAQQAIETATSLAGRIALVIVNHAVALVPGRNLVEVIQGFQPDVKVLRYSGETEENLRATGQIKPEAFFLQKTIHRSSSQEEGA